jgi:hypothetical protein
MILAYISYNNAFCQNYYKIHSDQVAYYDTGENIFKWGEKKYVNMELIMKGNILLISDKAKSSYVTSDQIYNKVTDDYVEVAWNAIDEKNDGCIIKMVYQKENGNFTGDCELYIFYKTFAVKYDVSLD